MGEERVKMAESAEQVQAFMKSVLKDLRALKYMLDENWFETDTMHIGAEQEVCLINRNAKALPLAMEIMEVVGDKNYTTELAKFNLEVNLTPLPFTGSCLSQMEHNLLKDVDYLRKTVNGFKGDILLTGILPTIRKKDVDMENLTPLPRYKALCDAITRLRGGEYDLRIQGMDELLMRFDSPLLEACNTGFQVHLQVKPDEFVRKYNIAQAVAGPVLACAVNSPVLFGKRLWAETRVALFQQSIDTRQVGSHLRDSSPRVTFGNTWLEDSILDIYKEDITRYRVLLSADVSEDVETMLKEGKTPELMALKVHNSTVYRWNRPCYGISANGKPHLRIENRVFPSGPTMVDEIANAAFWLGLLNGFEDAYGDITQKLDFDDARMNFFAASKMGLETKFIWTDDRRITAVDLIKEELLPIAGKGLEKAGISPSDIEMYLNIIEDRVSSAQTGSYWVVKSYASLIKEHNKEQTLSAIATAMLKNQKKGEPVHRWGLAREQDMENWKPSTLLVEEFMTTDLFTVHKDDIIELVANMMDWRKIRYVPVEDDQKHLIGLITMPMILREYSKTVNENEDYTNHTVREIMVPNPITIHPEATIMEAMAIMQSQKISCLPVVKNSRLVGIITEGNYMNITRRLLKALAEEREH